MVSALTVADPDRLPRISKIVGSPDGRAVPSLATELICVGMVRDLTGPKYCLGCDVFYENKHCVCVNQECNYPKLVHGHHIAMK